MAAILRGRTAAAPYRLAARIGFRDSRPVNRITTSLSAYLGARFLAALAVVTGVIAGLILLFDLVELMRQGAVRGTAAFSDVFGLALLKLPHTVEDTFPFAVLIATMYGLFRLSRHHELVVMRSIGISAWQVLAPTVALAAGIGVAAVLMFNPVAAGMYDQYLRLSRELLAPRATAVDIGRTGFWLREARPEGAAVVHADSVALDEGTLRLHDAVIFLTDNREQFVRRIEAKEGELLDGVFRLLDVRDMEPGKPTVVRPEFFLPTRITFTQVQDNFARPETLSFWDLPGFIRFSRAAGFSALPHRLYLQSLLATPLMLCAMVLVGASFFMTALARAGVWTVRALGGIAAGFVLYFFSQFTYALGLSATLPVALAAWAPVMVAALLSLTFLFYREDG